MQLVSGKKVTIIRKSYGVDTMEEGTLLDEIFSHTADPVWRVEIFVDGERYVECCRVSELQEWNAGSYSSSCECGADKLGHPGHSHWCKLHR